MSALNLVLMNISVARRYLAEVAPQQENIE